MRVRMCVCNAFYRCMYVYTGCMPVPLLFVYCAISNQYLLSNGTCYTLIIWGKKRGKKEGGKEKNKKKGGNKKKREK